LFDFFFDCFGDKAVSCRRRIDEKKFAELMPCLFFIPVITPDVNGIWGIGIVCVHNLWAPDI